ncbi:MAG: ribose-5-phosphate isomerase RpiA [Phycisphaeraceae bacterium]|nr:ribose-5-phosphate isomerase RpiA [Phycisphaeraceae bacterium]
MAESSNPHAQHTTAARLAAAEATHDSLARAAVADIRPGMIVGLGTGRTARRAIAALAGRIIAEQLEVTCVSTSEASSAYAQELGIKVREFATIEHVDYLFDGADEVDPHLRMLKGAGGAMTRERMVATAAARRVYLVEEEKLVDHLGERTPLAVAVMAFGLASIRANLRGLGLSGVLRRSMDGTLYVTDNGNLILDVQLHVNNGDEHAYERIATALNNTPGVIDHGLFLTEATEVLVRRDDGSIERLLRAPAAN